MTKLHNDYYTYAYLREDKTPYYIGKGRGKRIYCKNRTIKAPKDKSLILFLKKNLTEAEAFKHEIYMIFVLGRKDLGTGILRNLTNGGEGASGAVISAETKKKLSEARKGKYAGEKNPMYGVPKTEAQKKTQSKKLTGRYLGALNPSSKAIIAIEPDGTQRHYGSGREAARNLEINRGDLSRYLKSGKSPRWGKWKGWQFLFKNSEDS
jgi:hypothetical protein